MSDPIYFPGGRDARGTLDVASADEGDGETETDYGTSAATDGTDASVATGDAPACVVACPPHPQHGGHRGDQRLRAVSDELGERGIDCLRFDYGPWDGGRGERSDATNAVGWARDRYDHVGLFGYSFGGSVAVSAAANGADVVAVAALSPPARVGNPGTDASEAGETEPSESETVAAETGGIDTVDDLSAVPASTPVGVFYGARDDVADVGPVVERALERGFEVREFPSDHFFVGKTGAVATAVADFMVPALRTEGSN